MMKIFLYAAIGIISGLINGILGAGGGTVIVPSLHRFLKIPPHKAHATAISIILPITMVSSYFYSRQGLLDKNITLVIALSGMAGGFTGAKFLKKLSGKAIRIVFAVSMIMAGIRMLWV